ncbi:DUF397 domain-containing protein [Streptomyces sp. RG38]|uniref:DUF397 domain-containing protein n=1 Tax=Streptomyces tagetis TaxID=2820809 RepID=A0A940XR89_9ACTN|nr:DUF397 domain-containing protein [Streptomyces sp. RG38]
MTDTAGPFGRSSYSAQMGECVEVAHTPSGRRVVRDSKRENGPALSVSRDGWRAFLRQFA